jgi:cupin superfamily acireductone dioxygenase involved in methionine salvage
MKRHGEAASANADTVEQERKRIQELIKKYGYRLRDIFNMDETGLFYGYVDAFAFDIISDSSM